MVPSGRLAHFLFQCGDAVIFSPVARGCCSPEDVLCGRLSVKPRQEEFWMSQYPVPCHLTNLFGWVGGWVGSPHITPYPSYVHCCIKHEGRLFSVVARIPGIIICHKGYQLSNSFTVNRQMLIERVCMYLKQAFWKAHEETEEKEPRRVAALLNRLDIRYRSSTTPHPTPQTYALIHSQKSRRRSF